MNIGGKSKSFKERLAYLGPLYTAKIIDFEWCIYHKLNNVIDFEVSGANNNKTRNLCMSVYVWCYMRRIVEEVHNIRTVSRLDDILTELVAKYRKSNSNEII